MDHLLENCDQTISSPPTRVQRCWSRRQGLILRITYKGLLVAAEAVVVDEVVGADGVEEETAWISTRLTQPALVVNVESIGF